MVVSDVTEQPMLLASIRSIRRETPEVLSFELVNRESCSLPPVTPGAHIDVHISPNLIRQYSLCNGPGAPSSYWIAVKKEPASRGGSAAMHERVKEGDVLRISAPRNNFPLDWSAKRHLLLAGGIGITPILSMARHLNEAGASFQMQYFTRSIEHTAFHNVLSATEFRGKVVFHYALEPDALRTYLRKLLWTRPEGASMYLCGPRPFMDLVETTAAATWPPESIHSEYFGADPMALAGARRTFRVTLARSGTTFIVPEGKTIVEALAEHGVRIETSCEQGVCGTCLTGVLQGVPDHRDVFLTDEEKRSGGKIMPCVSRSNSPVLVLDL